MSDEADAVTEFEATLARLTPSAAGADPVAAAYAAGHAAGRRGVNRWRVGAGAAVVIAVGPWLAPRSALPPPDRPAVVAAPPSQPVAIPDPWPLRAAVLARGLDGVPPIRLPSPRSADRFDLQ